MCDKGVRAPVLYVIAVLLLRVPWVRIEMFRLTRDLTGLGPPQKPKQPQWPCMWGSQIRASIGRILTVSRNEGVQGRGQCLLAGKFTRNPVYNCDCTCP